ncbi:MAG TPA: uroporphyrinogen-III synthase [Planctomycetia bacterium]|nr:uroporphyrinogen-III synthase [Planctomycetia bacterium]
MNATKSGVVALVGAGAGIPLTHRTGASAVAFITGHEDPAKSALLDWSALAAFPGTLVVYMPLARRRALAVELVARGKDPATPVAFVAWGGTNRQQVASLSLAELAAGREPPELAAIPSPAVAIIGAVCDYRERLRWFEDRPLFGRRLLLLRPSRTDDWNAALEAAGAVVSAAPAFDIVPPADMAPLDGAIRRASTFDWIVFASPAAAHAVCDRPWQIGLDLRSLAGPRLAAVGDATKSALASHGLRADLVPADPTADGLAAELAPQARRKRFLLPRADRGRTLLEDSLRAAGAEVEPVIAYVQQDRAAPPPLVAAALAAGEIDWALLTSPNVAAAFFRWQAAAGPGAAKIRLASIGPTTSAAIVAAGRNVDTESHSPDVEGMIAAIGRAAE